jgi:hypothetical protein
MERRAASRKGPNAVSLTQPFVTQQALPSSAAFCIAAWVERSPKQFPLIKKVHDRHQLYHCHLSKAALMIKVSFSSADVWICC